MHHRGPCLRNSRFIPNGGYIHLTTAHALRRIPACGTFFLGISQTLNTLPLDGKYVRNTAYLRGRPLSPSRAQQQPFDLDKLPGHIIVSEANDVALAVRLPLIGDACPRHASGYEISSCHTMTRGGRGVAHPRRRRSSQRPGSCHHVPPSAATQRRGGACTASEREETVSRV